MTEHERMGMLEACSILGIEQYAGSAEVRAAYTQRLREHPPERDPEGFKRVREAYETLRSPRKRAELTLLDLRHGPTEFDHDRLRDSPPPAVPERFVDHLIAVLLADVNAAIDREIARAREVAPAASGSPGGAAC